MRRLAIALALLTVWMAAPAQARHAVDSDLPRALAVAHTVFPAACYPARIVDTEPLGGDDVRPGLLVNARAYEGGEPGCVIWLAPDWRTWATPVELCAVLAHETGHLAGREHSPDPHDVMYAGDIVVPAQCAAAWRAPRLRAEWARPWLKYAA